MSNNTTIEKMRIKHSRTQKVIEIPIKRDRLGRFRKMGDNNDYTDEIVDFKSKPYYFIKERDGVKPNTIRMFHEGDERFCMMNRWINNKKYGRIRITNTVGIDDFFERQITDITRYQSWFIISWRHR